MSNALKAARAAVNRETFGTDAWEAKMQIVRDLVDEANAAREPEEFRSVDSGEHPMTHLRYARDAEFRAAEIAAPSAVEAYWAESALASVKRDYAAGRARTIKA